MSKGWVVAVALASCALVVGCNHHGQPGGGGSGTIQDVRIVEGDKVEQKKVSVAGTSLNVQVDEPVRVYSGQAWKYRSLILQNPNISQDLQTAGRHGWEVAAAVSNGGSVFVILKKPIPWNINDSRKQNELTDVDGSAGDEAKAPK